MNEDEKKKRRTITDRRCTCIWSANYKVRELDDPQCPYPHQARVIYTAGESE